MQSQQLQRRMDILLAIMALNTSRGHRGGQTRAWSGGIEARPAGRSIRVNLARLNGPSDGQ